MNVAFYNCEASSFAGVIAVDIAVVKAVIVVIFIAVIMAVIIAAVILVVHLLELFGDVQVCSIWYVFSDLVDDSHEALHVTANRSLDSVRRAVPSSQGIYNAIILESVFADVLKDNVGIQRTAVL